MLEALGKIGTHRGETGGQSSRRSEDLVNNDPAEQPLPRRKQDQSGKIIWNSKRTRPTIECQIGDDRGFGLIGRLLGHHLADGILISIIVDPISRSGERRWPLDIVSGSLLGY
jgi:hypothetical protein